MGCMRCVGYVLEVVSPTSLSGILEDFPHEIETKKGRFEVEGGILKKRLIPENLFIR